MPMLSHTQVGEKATGAKVNGRMVPLTAKLKTGDVVEIVTNANSFGPSRDWIKMVKTTKARNKIRQFFKNQDKEASITKGRELLIAYFQEHGYIANKYLDKKHIEEILPRMSVRSEEALYAAVGFGEISAAAVFNRLTEKERREEERAKAKAEAEELMNGGEVKTEKKEVLKVKSENGVIIKVLQASSCVSLSAVTQYLEMRLKVTLPRVVVSLFTVQIVIISRVKKVMNNV